VLPAKPRDAAEVAVAADPLAPGFDRDRDQVGVRDQVALGPGRHAQPFEDLPVAGAGSDDHRVGLCPERVLERECLPHRRRRIEDAGMGRDAHEAAQHELGYPERLVTCDRGLEPRPVGSVLW
jgi:hypothetical protein